MEMELEQALHKRVRGMAVRILSCLEHSLSCHLDGIGDNEKFTLDGADLKTLRGVILDAAGDTTRSLAALVHDAPRGGSKLSLPREMIAALNSAMLKFVKQDRDEEVPVCEIRGEFVLLTKIRDLIGAGVVYNGTYTCVGLDAIIEHLVPFLDRIQSMGIKIAGGVYKSWRDDVCDMYLEGLNDE